MNGLESEFAGRAAVLRLDAAEVDNLRLQASFNQRGHPSFVVLNEREDVVGSFFGAQPEAVLREALNEAVGGE